MRTGSVRRVIGAAIAVVLLSQVAAVLILNADVASAGASTAGFTSVNESVDGAGKCNNKSAVNCNNYTGKQFAWMNGGPAGSCLDDGDYFFAVTTPSGDPNDGQPGNLSDDFD